MQISEQFENRKVNLHGLEFRLDQLCAGCLITGIPGTGKTKSIVNPLTNAILADCAGDLEHKAACVYFNCKGEGHFDLINRLPESRRDDVVILSPGCDTKLCLFPETHWPDPFALAEAAREYLIELARQCAGTDDRAGGYRVYWDGTRDRVMESAAKMREGKDGVTDRLQRVFFPDSSVAGILRRLRMLRHAVAAVKSRPDKETPMEDLITQLFGPKATADSLLVILESAKTALLERTSDPEGYGPDALMAGYMAGLIKQFSLRSKGGSKSSPAERSYQAICEAVPSGTAHLLANHWHFWQRASQELWQSIDGELQPLQAVFSSPLAGMLLAENLGDEVVSFESLIDEGKILIIDLPMTDSAGAARSLLLALQLAFTKTLLARRTLLSSSGKPINGTRPVVFVADEFHSFLSSGRTDGIEVFLSQAREFGCISILATQNLRLVQSALADHAKFSALVGLVGTRFFGRNLDAFTNEFAAESCGSSNSIQDRQFGMVFPGCDPEIATLLRQKSAQVAEALTPSQLCSLQPGQFVCVDLNGKARLIDARDELSSPQIIDLSLPT